MAEARRKAMQSVDVKAGDSGEVEAVFATLNVVDHDGDVMRKEAFTDGAPVVISAYGHRSHMGELPIGKGRIEMTDTEARMKGQFFLDTTHGRDAFTTIKNLSDDDQLQEWSFSLRDVTSHTEQVEGREANVITAVTVKEVSPVLEGAGIDTHTVVAKGDPWVVGSTYVPPMPYISAGNTTGTWYHTLTKTGSRFVDQAEAVAEALAALVQRAGEIAAMRAAKGEQLGADTVGVLDRLATEAARIKALIEPPSFAENWSPLVALLELAELEAVT